MHYGHTVHGCKFLRTQLKTNVEYFNGKCNNLEVHKYSQVIYSNHSTSLGSSCCRVYAFLKGKNNYCHTHTVIVLPHPHERDVFSRHIYNDFKDSDLHVSAHYQEIYAHHHHLPVQAMATFLHPLLNFIWSSWLVINLILFLPPFLSFLPSFLLLPSFLRVLMYMSYSPSQSTLEV